MAQYSSGEAVTQTRGQRGNGEDRWRWTWQRSKWQRWGHKAQDHWEIECDRTDKIEKDLEEEKKKVSSIVKELEEEKKKVSTI